MKKKAFTLIELLIVIAILGILVALILPRFADVRRDANYKVCIANIRGLVGAMSTYETKENDDTATWGPTGEYTNTNLKVWEYVADIPYCPYEQGKPTPTEYTLSGGSGQSPPAVPAAACPNVLTYDDHVWP